MTEWFNEYGESILTYILLMVRDYQQAEDLTQETFIKAYRHQKQYEQKSSVWLRLEYPSNLCPTFHILISLHFV